MLRRDKQYVLGFMFDPQGKYVILIRKNKPEWQKGRMNGVGGKIEGEESAYDAMQREFREETGVDMYSSNWRRYTTMEGSDWLCHVFYCFDIAYAFADTQEEEETVLTMAVEDVLQGRVAMISNIPWLISMAIDDKFGDNVGTIHAKVEYV